MPSGRPSPFSKEQKAHIEGYYPRLEDLVEKLDKSHSGRNSHRISQLKQDWAQDILRHTLFQNKLDAKTPHSVWKSRVVRMFHNHLNNRVKKLKSESSPTVDHSFVKLSTQLTGRELFEREHRDEINEEASRRRADNPNSSHVGCYQKVLKEMWDDEGVDQAAYEARAAEASGNVAENQKVFNRDMFTALRNLCRSGKLGPMEIFLAYSFRDPNTNAVIAGKLEVHSESNGRSFSQEFPEVVDQFKGNWSAFANMAIPSSNTSTASTIALMPPVPSESTSDVTNTALSTVMPSDTPFSASLDMVHAAPSTVMPSAASASASAADTPSLTSLNVMHTAPTAVMPTMASISDTPFFAPSSNTPFSPSLDVVHTPPSTVMPSAASASAANTPSLTSLNMMPTMASISDTPFSTPASDTPFSPSLDVVHAPLSTVTSTAASASDSPFSTSLDVVHTAPTTMIPTTASISDTPFSASPMSVSTSTLPVSSSLDVAPASFAATIISSSSTTVDDTLTPELLVNPSATPPATPTSEALGSLPTSPLTPICDTEPNVTTKQAANKRNKLIKPQDLSISPRRTRSKPSKDPQRLSPRRTRSSSGLKRKAPPPLEAVPSKKHKGWVWVPVNDD